MEDVLELAKRVAEGAEVYQVVSWSTPVSFEANRLKLLETKQTRGLALRIIRNGRLGFSATTDLRDPARLVDSAAQVADLGAEAKFTFPATTVRREVQVYDPLVEGLAVEAMIDIGRGLIEHVRASEPDALCDVGVSKHVAEVFIINSSGGEAAYKKSVISVALHANLIRDTDMLDVYEEDVSCRLASDYLELAKRLVTKLHQAKATVRLPTKPMSVLFAPKGFAGTLVLPVQAALNGKTVLQGASALGDKLGDQVFDDRLSLYDDGTVDFAPRSAICDDEGVPTQRTVLIEKGVLTSFYYDLQTAGLAGRESTGNGFRGLYSLPSPSLTSLIVGEGEATFEEMLRSVKEGLLVDQVMGAWAGNLLSGDFSANVHLGYKIENGEIVGRVKDTMVAGNVFELFKQAVQAVGNQAVWVGGSLKLPPLLLSSVSVSSKG